MLDWLEPFLFDMMPLVLDLRVVIVSILLVILRRRSLELNIFTGSITYYLVTL